MESHALLTSGTSYFSLYSCVFTPKLKFPSELEDILNKIKKPTSDNAETKLPVSDQRNNKADFIKKYHDYVVEKFNEIESKESEFSKDVKEKKLTDLLKIIKKYDHELEKEILPEDEYQALNNDPEKKSRFNISNLTNTTSSSLNDILYEKNNNQYPTTTITGKNALQLRKTTISKKDSKDNSSKQLRVLYGKELLNNYFLSQLHEKKDGKFNINKSHIDKLKFTKTDIDIFLNMQENAYFSNEDDQEKNNKRLKILNELKTNLESLEEGENIQDMPNSAQQKSLCFSCCIRSKKSGSKTLLDLIEDKIKEIPKKDGLKQSADAGVQADNANPPPPAPANPPPPAPAPPAPDSDSAPAHPAPQPPAHQAPDSAPAPSPPAPASNPPCCCEIPKKIIEFSVKFHTSLSTACTKASDEFNEKLKIRKPETYLEAPFSAFNEFIKTFSEEMKKT